MISQFLRAERPAHMTPVHSRSERQTRGGLLAVAALVCALFAGAAHAAFTVNGNGTVTDTTTGLVWDRCPLGTRTTAAYDCYNNLQFFYSWADALAQVSVRNAANHLGFNDWRMPNKKELESLVKLDAFDPAIDLTVFPPSADFAYPLYTYTWTSTPTAVPDYAWAVDFIWGRDYAGRAFGPANLINLYFVRLVRDGQPVAAFDALAPLNAACGSAHNPGSSPLLTAAPSANLCSPGNASAVTAGTTTYLWSCAGLNGGTNANCSAPRGYQVTPAITGSGTISPATDQVVAYQSTPMFTATPDSGYAVSLWNDTCTGTVSGIGDVNFTVDPVTANCKLRVTFALGASHTITSARNPTAGGTVTCTPKIVTYGGSSTCTQTPNAGYAFVGWSGACTGTGACTLSNVITDLTVTANFGYAVTGTASPTQGGSVTCSPNPVAPGATTSCTVSTNAGYTLTGVSGCGSGSLSGNTYTTPAINAACTVTASFAVNTYNILKQSNPLAGGTVTCTPDPVSHGGSTSCSPTPNAGYTFTNWSGACSGNGACAPSNVTANLTITANYTLNTYAVTGAASPAQGGSVVCTPNPVPHGATTGCTGTANAGYTLSSVSGCGSGSLSGITYTTAAITTPCTVTAIFTLNSYAVTAVATPALGGSITCTPNPVPHGATTACTITPNMGYSLAGVASGCSTSGSLVGNTYTTTAVTAACTLTAQFSVSTYVITRSASPVAGGSVACTPNPVTHGANTSCSQTPNAGYTFTGWSGACSGTGACSITNVTASQTVTANYSVNTYSILKQSNPIAGGTVTCTPDPVNHGASTSCTQTPNAGYTFANWSGACAGNGACAPSNVTANLTVTANYNITTYAIAASASPALGGSVICTPNPVNHGTSSGCSQTPNAGYSFTGWSGACTGTGSCSLTNVTANQSVTASYSLNTYSILKQSNPIAGGTVTCTPDPVNHGATTSCTQTPNAGYTFTNWSGACSGNGACAPSNVTANLTVTATYSLNSYTITRVVSPVAGGSVTCTPNPVSHGSSSTCSQTPNAGYTFTGWSGACTGNGACSLTNVTANQTVTASYSLNTYTVTSSAIPAAGGSMSCVPTTVNYNSTSTCTATPNLGYVLGVWGGTCTGAASGVGNMTYTSNPVTAICSVSVTFTPLPILNIDNSGAPTVYDGATDGLLLMRYLMGLRGAELVQDALGTSPQRDATQIEAHIQTYLTLFDVDGDGAVHPHTDGLLIYRRMLGLSGTALTHGANNGTRTDSQIAAAIDALKP